MPGDLFIGRLAQLQAACKVLRTPPAVVMVRGTAGSGKSRFLSQLLSRADSAGTLIAFRCPPTGDTFAFAAADELIRLCGGEPSSSAIGVHDRHHRLCVLLTGLPGPVTLAVDDLHLADRGSRAVLRCVAAQPPANVRLILVGTEPAPLPLLGAAWRPGAEVNWTSVSLPPLIPDETAALATDQLNLPLDPWQTARLAALTGGLPALIVELLRLLELGGATSDTLTRALRTPPVPHSVGDAITDFLHRAPAAARLLVETVAVLARPTTGQSELARLLGLPLPAAAAALEIATTTGPLTELAPGRYGYPQELHRLAVYRQLTGPRRQLLHHRVARHLDPVVTDAAVLARHHLLAGESEAACGFAERAADQALARGRPLTAQTLLRQVLSQPAGTGAERARLVAKLAQAVRQSMSCKDAIGMLRELVSAAGLPAALRGPLRMELGILLINQGGDIGAGRAELTAAVPELAEFPDLAARCMSMLLHPFWGDEELGDHMRWLERLVRLPVQPADLLHQSILDANRVSLLMAIGDPGVWAAASQLDRHRGSPLRDEQILRGYINLADAAIWVGHHDAAGAYLDKAQQIAEEVDAPYQVSLSEATRLRFDLATGQWDGLQQRAMRFLEHAGHTPLPASDGRLVCATLALAQGDWLGALAHATEPGLRTPSDGLVPAVVSAAVLRARARLGLGELSSAVREVSTAIEWLRGKRIWVWGSDAVVMAVRLLVRGGHTEEAHRLLAEFAAGLTGRDAPYASAAVTWCRAQIAEAAGSLEEAAEHYGLAADRLQRLRCRYEAAMTREAAACCRIAAGFPAAEPLLAAAEQYAQLGAALDSARCGRLLRHCGSPPPQRRGRRGYGDQLSPRERDVAKLAASGHTNRAIADALFLSPRTVEQHVARILRKLRITRREDIAVPTPTPPGPKI